MLTFWGASVAIVKGTGWQAGLDEADRTPVEEEGVWVKGKSEPESNAT